MTTRLFIYDETKPPIKYRPGTMDEAIINDVLVRRGEYLFPHYPDAAVVFDIGGNIGVTTVILADLYPQARIHSFEPESENFKLLLENTAHLENVVCHNTAVDNYTGKTQLFGHDNALNLGGFSTTIEPEKEAMPGTTVSVARMASLCDNLGTPDIIKIDCEGAEFNILTDVPDINKVLWISGELHGVRDFELLSELTQTHEIQTFRQFGQQNWNFQAAHRSKFFSPVKIDTPDKATRLAVVDSE